MSRLDLSDKEQLAMLYVLVKQVSQEDLSNLVPKYGRSSPSFAAFAKLVSIDRHHWGMASCLAYLNTRKWNKASRVTSALLAHLVFVSWLCGDTDRDCVVCSVLPSCSSAS